MNKNYILLITTIFFISFVSSASNNFGYNYLDNEEYVIEGANYSINVNNTEYFRGYSVNGLYNYFESLYDLVYCKLTGCTMEGDINMDSNNIQNVSVLEFNPDYAYTGSESIGSMYYNDLEGYYEVRMNDEVTLSLQGGTFYGKASEDIANGDVVMYAGVQGSHPLIKKANVTELEALPHLLLGIATQDILNNEFGYVTYVGLVNNVYTYDWLEGQILYLNWTDGNLTNVRPEKPNRVISFAIVKQEQSGASQTGKIYVRPTIGLNLNDISNVNDSSCPTGSVLIKNATSGIWQCFGNVDLGNYNLSSSCINLSGNIICNWSQVNLTTIPAGINGSIQFNDNGEFNGTSEFTYNKTRYSLQSGENVNALNTGSFAFGSGSIIYNTSIISSGDGSFAQGYIYRPYYSYNSSIISSSQGSFAQGVIDRSRGGSIPIYIISSGKGSFAQGIASGDSLNTGKIISSNSGSFAQGWAYSSSIISSGQGSFAQGMALTGNILSSGQGSFAQGIANQGNLSSSGQGSFAQGYVGQIKSISSSGQGSFAQGIALTGNILSSGQGSFAQGINNIYSIGNGAFTQGSNLNNSGNYSMLIGYNLSLLESNTFGFGSNYFFLRVNSTETILNSTNTYMNTLYADKSYITVSDPEVEVYSVINWSRALTLDSSVPFYKKGLTIFFDGTNEVHWDSLSGNYFVTNMSGIVVESGNKESLGYIGDDLGLDYKSEKYYTFKTINYTEIEYEPSEKIDEETGESIPNFIKINVTKQKIVQSYLPEFQINHHYYLGDMFVYDNLPYLVLQEHTSQSDWNPKTTKSLYKLKLINSETGYEEWVQPLGSSDAYQKGDIVLFMGVLYKSSINGNVWSPVVYPQGWEVYNE